ncbi:hypothetical protein FZC78_07725 [Rossellomorea vietnamensis]|uniref:Uncharacterized protein n=1 Tax=Rossellomorea vietnamensis TaxID=218284 RepID=A0A5D4NUY6_9BACI|nr:hypothetical protein [Rossellomorea vietnamensis]TYS17740.1 hypothetical protein FZC78_07725 [Rossellomorea vietnamensis]
MGYTKNLKKRMLTFIIGIFFFYISIYGTLSIFQDTILIRSIKDIALIVLILLSFIHIVLFKKYKSNIFIIFIISILGGIYLISFLSLLNGNSLVNLGYGIKISLLPMGGVLLGIYLKNKNIKIQSMLIVVFISLISTWTLQWFSGVDKLMQLGFEYAVNVKHINGIPRLPSSVGTPDGYAFLLAIIGVLLQVSLLGKNYKKFAFIVMLLTLSFLVLSTIRSALLLFVFCQLIVYLKKVSTSKQTIKYLYFTLLSFLMVFSILILPIAFSSGLSLFSRSSLVDRFSHWFSYLPSLTTSEGFIGYGLGVVGSASRRTADLGLNSTDYAVDNQYIAIFQQLGLLGLIAYFLFFIIVIWKLLNLHKQAIVKNRTVEVERLDFAVGLVLAVLVSGIFTNILEVYPFNLFFYVFIGMQLCPLTETRDVINLEKVNLA